MQSEKFNFVLCRKGEKSNKIIFKSQLQNFVTLSWELQRTYNSSTGHSSKQVEKSGSFVQKSTAQNVLIEGSWTVDKS